MIVLSACKKEGALKQENKILLQENKFDLLTGKTWVIQREEYFDNEKWSDYSPNVFKYKNIEIIFYRLSMVTAESMIKGGKIYANTWEFTDKSTKIWTNNLFPLWTIISLTKDKLVITEPSGRYTFVRK